MGAGVGVGRWSVKVCLDETELQMSRSQSQHLTWEFKQSSQAIW